MMSTVIIKVDTGFVGGEHDCDTGIEINDWKELSFEEKQGIYSEAVWNFIEAYAVDENGNDIE